VSSSQRWLEMEAPAMGRNPLGIAIGSVGPTKTLWQDGADRAVPRTLLIPPTPILGSIDSVRQEFTIQYQAHSVTLRILMAFERQLEVDGAHDAVTKLLTN
jgi:hypothetical protein